MCMCRAFGIADAVSRLPFAPMGGSDQRDAAQFTAVRHEVLISTDPPYYDNIFYALWLHKNRAFCLLGTAA